MIYRGYRRQALDFYTSLDIRKKEDKGEQHNYFVDVLLVQGETPEDKLKTLNECNCCDRHKTNKPEHVNSVIKNNVPFQKSARHRSRGLTLQACWGHERRYLPAQC